MAFFVSVFILLTWFSIHCFNQKLLLIPSGMLSCSDSRNGRNKDCRSSWMWGSGSRKISYLSRPRTKVFPLSSQQRFDWNSSLICHNPLKSHMFLFILIYLLPIHNEHKHLQHNFFSLTALPNCIIITSVSESTIKFGY